MGESMDGTARLSIKSTRFGTFDCEIGLDGEGEDNMARREITDALENVREEARAWLYVQPDGAAGRSRELALDAPHRRYPVRILKRNECSVLTLTLTHHWFDMIARGVKKEEYRERSAFHTVRFKLWLGRYRRLPTERRHLVVAFQRGRAKPSMWWECCVGFEDTGHRKRHPEWGEPDGRHYVVKLNSRARLED